MAVMTMEPVKVTVGGNSLTLSLTATSAPSVKAQSKLERENEKLAKENAALQQRLALAQENAALAQENARLAQQNAILSMSQGNYTASGMQGSWYGNPHEMHGGYAMDATQLPFCGAPPGLEGELDMNRSTNMRSMVQKVRAKAKVDSDDASSTSSGYTSSCRSTTSGCSESTTSASSSEDGDSSGSTQEGTRTTVMIRNVPNNYTRELLLTLMEEKGFSGCYDLVYLPVDFKTEAALGYSFINFTNSEAAERFRSVFEGFQEWSVISDKVCEVSWSDAIQGLHNNVEHFRNSPVMHETVPDEFKPAIFKDGKRADFPTPTKKLRAPRLWSRRQGSA